MKPNIYHFHSYHEYLKSIFNYSKTKKMGSLRKVATQIGLSPAYLSLIINGERDLSDDNAIKLLDYFGHSEREKKFFQALIRISDSNDQHERVKAFEELKKYREFKDHFGNELEAFRYLTKWYYMAIREMANLPDFKRDPQLIQKRLRKHVPTQEIRDALDFLINAGFITKSDNHNRPLKQIKCLDGIYRLSMKEFYQQTQELIKESINDDERDERLILGHTVAVDAAHLQKIESILKEAMEKIGSLTSPIENKEGVRYIQISSIPLTRRAKP